MDTKDEPAIKNNSGFIESAGHVAAIYQNELYNHYTAKRGTQMLLWVLYGTGVWLYMLSQHQNHDELVTNTARTALQLNEAELTV